MWVIAVIILILLVLAIPFVLERRKSPLSEAERANAQGEFAPLSQGVTYYRWFGPARGKVAVVVPGYAAPSVSMHDVAEGLGEMGYRVLVYDLYGRGLSDAPKGRQNRGFFLRQLNELLVFLDLTGELTLVGYSLGGSIATIFAAQNPHRINRVILFATTGVTMSETRFARFTRRVPVFGDWVHLLFMGGRLLRRIPGETDNPLVRLVNLAQRQDLTRRGYLPALLSSRRGLLAERLEKEHRALGKAQVPLVAIWAGKDHAIPKTAPGVLAQWNRNARQEMVDRADHALPYTHGAALIKALRFSLRD
jgi:pimeloyl-ACP methyl ester carboxylesterase